MRTFCTSGSLGEEAGPLAIVNAEAGLAMSVVRTAAALRCRSERYDMIFAPHVEWTIGGQPAAPTKVPRPCAAKIRTRAAARAAPHALQSRGVTRSAALPYTAEWLFASRS